MIYLDNNATTEPLPEVREAVIRALEIGPSNPSSSHVASGPARRLITEARDSVAHLIGASPEEIYFTSGGTEANNWALHVIRASGKRVLVTSRIEHESILRTAEILEGQGIQVRWLSVDRNGLISIDEASAVIDGDVGLASIQWVNNETGIVQPIGQLAALCSAKGVLFHTDAAQAVGKLDVDVRQLGASYMSFTGHKFHAPMGVGALYRHRVAPLVPLLGGGMQESGLRPGSENIAGIAGIGAAARIRALRLSKVRQHIAAVRDFFEARLLSACDGAEINTKPSSPRICNTTNVRFCHVNGEALLAQLITAGICCSQGSACTSQIPEPSHTLLAMGLTQDEAYQSIRFSFSELNTMDEVAQAVNVIASAYSRLRIGAGEPRVLAGGQAR